MIRSKKEDKIVIGVDMTVTIKVTAGSIEASVQLLDTATATAVVKALPFESTAHRWGEEIYFDIPLERKLENGREVLDEGDVAYWPPGKSMCIFFGPTPSSRGNEIRAASAVSVFGKVVGDARVFREVKEGDRIRVERVE